VLTEFYKTKPSEDLQYAIEEAMHWMPKAYAGLNSQCGPVPSIVEPSDPSQAGPPEPGVINITFSYCSSGIGMNMDAGKFLVVLSNTETGKQYVIRTGFNAPTEGGAGGGGDALKLPQGLPHGRYSVTMELRDGITVISHGHGYVADL
jgi:hypothetical protein